MASKQTPLNLINEYIENIPNILVPSLNIILLNASSKKIIIPEMAKDSEIYFLSIKTFRLYMEFSEK